MMGGGFGMGLGLLVPLLLVGLLVWLVTGGARRFGVERGVSASDDSALNILRERYARGEIDREEYDARRRDLS